MITNFLPILAAGLLLGNTNTSSQFRNDPPTRNDVTSVTILGPSGKSTILPPTPIDVEANETVMDLSIQTFKNNKLQFKITGLGNARYVLSIDNLAQRDMGPTSGWLYKVNDTFPDESPSLYQVKPGDKITWIYTTNLGKDVDAPAVLFEGRNNQMNNRTPH